MFNEKEQRQRESLDPFDGIGFIDSKTLIRFMMNFCFKYFCVGDRKGKKVICKRTLTKTVRSCYIYIYYLDDTCNRSKKKKYIYIYITSFQIVIKHVS